MLKNYALRRLQLLGVGVVHLIVPIWFIAQMAATGNQDTSTWLMQLFAAAAYVFYIALAGAWSWFGTYMQRSMPVIFVAVAFITRPRYVSVTNSAEAAELRLLAFALGILFLVLTILALLGRVCRKPALELTFPFRDGHYIIGQGGRTKVINHHARDKAQRYALDISKLGNFGIRARGIYPIALKKYAIYGVEVVSPCEGVVAAVVEDEPDRIPPVRDRSHPAGNYVDIELEGATIKVAHLMKGSVTVNPGQRVRAGQVLGRVGNSGNTTEPHLHIHATRDGVGIPMRFKGRFLVRNDLVEA
jgi:hypothetical protein